MGHKLRELKLRAASAGLIATRPRYLRSLEDLLNIVLCHSALELLQFSLDRAGMVLYDARTTVLEVGHEHVNGG